MIRSRPGRRGDRWTVLLAALAIAGAGEGLRAQEDRRTEGRETSVRIDFETWPDGSPTCERCVLSEQYRSRGVAFDFFSRFTGETDPYLIGSGAYDPEGEETNHAVTAALTEEGFRPGLLVLRFPDGPGRVAFRLRGPDVMPRFDVRASAPDGSPLPDSSVERRASGTYRAVGGGRFREESLSIESGRGIGRIELDGRGPPGHILLVDDLTVWPRPERAGGEVP